MRLSRLSAVVLTIASVTLPVPLTVGALPTGPATTAVTADGHGTPVAPRDPEPPGASEDPGGPTTCCVFI